MAPRYLALLALVGLSACTLEPASHAPSEAALVDRAGDPTVGGTPAPSVTTPAAAPVALESAAPEPALELRVDRDGDGALAPIDCDDADPTRSPLYPDDPCDGIDQNCNGVDDCDTDADGWQDRDDCAPLDARVTHECHPDWGIAWPDQDMAR